MPRRLQPTEPCTLRTCLRCERPAARGSEFCDHLCARAYAHEHERRGPHASALEPDSSTDHGQAWRHGMRLPLQNSA